MKQILIGFITNDGQKHLGYYTPVTNPCADYNEPDSTVEMYTDEYGNVHKQVSGSFPVNNVDFYYWDTQKNNYNLLEPPQKITLPEKTMGLFAKDIITSETPIVISKYRMIREWLLLNAECTEPIYLDRNFLIHTNGKVDIINEKSPIPDFIQFANR